MPFFGVPLRNGIPIGLGSTAGFGAAPFTPAELFYANEQGFWYDPSDFSAMFQDSAGTTPVTAVEQPVGLMLDKSGNNNHASQATPAYRPVLSAKVNLLTYTEQFNNGVWVQAPGSQTTTVTANAGVAPDGTTTADEIAFAAVSGSAYAIRWQNIAVASASYTSALYVKAKAAGDVGKTISVYTNDLVGSPTIVNHVLTSSWVRVTNTATLSASAVAKFTVASLGATTGGVNQGAFSALVWGADLRVANDGVGIPAYQRVAAATDYDTTGFPYYLRFDGSDDGLATSSIDFSATDQMSVFAGARKLTDGAAALVVELSDAVLTNNGSFNILAPDAALNSFAYRSRGDAAVPPNATASGYIAPITGVLAASSDISADLCNLRVNGAQAASSSSDQGAGNYGNYPIYIGRRLGFTLPFNGRLYSLIGVNRVTTDAETVSTETWVNSKTAAY